MPPITTQIATSDASTITVRGKDLVNELMGRCSYTEMMYFLICNRMPSPAQTKVLDACLVTLMEHGFTPSALIARLVLDSVPDQVQVAMASGLMAVGSVFVGTMEGCAVILQRGVAEGGDLDAYCQRVVAEHRAARRPFPGFGHPFHKPDDPRSPRLLAIAAEAGVSGAHVDLLKRLGTEIDRAYGRHLTLNATGAIGALLLEIGIPAEIMRAIAVVSRCGGLPGHIMEERRTHSARTIWQLTEEHIPYEAPAHGA
ncbi:MAG: citryl-CoA lyase [Alphaproteobacteria bacterium]|nr:citryl-CoA lyase [Alphaproteobacteria bacterium]